MNLDNCLERPVFTLMTPNWRIGYWPVFVFCLVMTPARQDGEVEEGADELSVDLNINVALKLSSMSLSCSPTSIAVEEMECVAVKPRRIGMWL